MGGTFTACKTPKLFFAKSGSPRARSSRSWRINTCCGSPIAAPRLTPRAHSQPFGAATNRSSGFEVTPQGAIICGCQIFTPIAADAGLSGLSSNAMLSFFDAFYPLSAAKAAATTHRACCGFAPGGIAGITNPFRSSILPRRFTNCARCARTRFCAARAWCRSSRRRGLSRRGRLPSRMGQPPAYRPEPQARADDEIALGQKGRVPRTTLRCMTRRCLLSSKLATARWRRQRLSHITRSPTRQRWV